MKKIFLIFFITFSVVKSTTTPAVSDQTLINNSIDLINQDQDLTKSIKQTKNELQIDKKEKNKVQQNINSYIYPAVDEKVQEAFRNSNLSPLGKDGDQYNRVRTAVENEVNNYITNKNIKNSVERDFHTIEGDFEKAMPILGAGIMINQVHEMSTSRKKEAKTKAEREAEKAANEKRHKDINDKLNEISSQNKTIIEEQNKKKLNSKKSEIQSEKQELNTKKNEALNAADARKEENDLNKDSEYNYHAGANEEEMIEVY